MRVTAGDDLHAKSAAVELQRFREKMLRWLIWASLTTTGLVAVLLTPRTIQARNYPYLAFYWLVVLYLVLLAVSRRWLPLVVRAWLFSLPGLLHVGLLYPALVDPVALAGAVLCCTYLTALAGIRHGAVLGGLLIAGLLTAGLLAPDLVDPARLEALPRGPLELIVIATGTIPLVVIGTVAVHIVLRGMVASFEDALSSLRKAQQSDRRFRGIFENMPIPTALVRLPGARIADVNAAFERVLGWSRAEVVGERAAALGILRDVDEQGLEGRLRMGQAMESVEVTARRRDGAEVQMILQLRPAELDGERVGLVIGRDVTQERQLESALRHAQRIETTGQLAAGIAHNFRNALGAILPNLDVCLEEAPEALRPALRDARTAASAAVDLAKRLTSLARKDGAASAPAPVAMGALLADLAALCRSTFGARIAIVLDVAEDGVVLADRGELHQVFLNLLLNARDALGQTRDPQVTLRLRRSEDGCSLVASVADNGAGMDETTLRRLGEPFFTTKGSGTGTGLGLTTAFTAVRAAGGSITVESQPGAGSIFSVQLPLSAAAPAERPHVAGRLGGRALVVDDDPLVLEAVGRQLGGLGIDADLVQGGRQAAVRLREAAGAYALFITDVDMPEVDGRELVSLARSVAPALPILVITGSPGAEPVEGARAVLCKPVSTVELAEAAARALGVEAVALGAAGEAAVGAGGSLSASGASPWRLASARPR